MTVAGLRCLPAEARPPDQITCTVTLSGVAPRDVTVGVTASGEDVCCAAPVVVGAGQRARTFVLQAVSGSGAPTTITARLDAKAVTTTVLVRMITA